MNNAQEQEKNAAAADLPERPRRKMWNSVSWGSGAA